MIRRVEGWIEDPRRMKQVTGWGVLFFTVLVPIAHVTGWVDSKTFISDLSLIALILSMGAWWQASSVEVKQDEAEAARRDDG